ncbi:MAG: carbohydrate kinase family protein [Chloroflexi bacterium]|nr:MAG: carbohydrate kinase family protein [Chloroflexota bacterium]RLC87007.1 MAG: carbohydrate kinase family protein [Chloroflexota bacterium]HEY73968.1 carbohydrate kinase family protein [Thermoflexia bacterium]
MNIVVTGSIAYDYLMTFPGRFVEHILPDQLDHISLSFLVDEMRRQRGGCAANIAYNLALLGERPRLMGTVGQDFGEYRVWLKDQGVDTSLTRDEPDLFTASFFVNTDQDGNQIASFYTGAMARARELSFHDLNGEQVDLVAISPNDPEAMVKYPAECQELDIPYLYDPSQQIIRLSGEDLREGLAGCDILVVNEYEFEMLREKTGLSAEETRSAPSRACVVTLGEQGSRIWVQGTLHIIPPVPPRQSDDPTGVGDAFRAGLIKGLALNLSWELAGKMGALAATYALEQPGPQSHSYTLSEFVARFREHFDDEGALDQLID